MTNPLILKYFGDTEKLNEVFSWAEKIAGCKLSYDINTVFGDSEIKIEFVGGEEKTVQDAVRFIVSTLKEGIYAERSASLSQTLFDLLRLRKLKISVAESFTAGRVVSEIIKNSGASEVVSEGIVSYSNESKMRRLNVEERALIEDGAVSSKVAYQMAAGLISTEKCDVAISTTGIAGPNSDDTLKPVGLCYIAVGDVSGIHVHKYVLKGDREEITETAKNTALFLAIKNIRNSRG